MDDPVTYQAVVALNINPLLVHNEGHGCSVEECRILLDPSRACELDRQRM